MSKDWNTMSSNFVRELLDRRLTYGQKFIFVCLVFAAAIGLVSYFLIAEQNRGIRRVTLELEGLSYQRTLQNVYENVLWHYMQGARYFTYDPSAKAELIALEAKITSDLTKLVALDQLMEQQMQTSLNVLQPKGKMLIKPTSIERRWNTLKSEFFELSQADSSELHIQLIESIRGLIIYISNKSTLLLDPQTVTFYLSNIILDHLPDFQYYIAQTIDLGLGILSQKEISREEETRLLFLSNMIKSNRDDIADKIHQDLEELTYTAEEIPFREATDTVFSSFEETASAFNNLILNGIIDTPKIELTPPELFTSGSEVLEASSKFWSGAAGELEKLLKIRKNSLLFQQWTTLLLAVGLALLGFLLIILMVRRITKPLSDLIAATNRLAVGDWSARAEILHDDEVGRVEAAFNNMAQSFQEILEQLQRAVAQLTNSSSNLASNSVTQESVVVQQESATREVAATINEISATSKELAGMMNKVSMVSEEAATLAKTGKENLNRMETTMHQMVNDTEHLSHQLADLKTKTDKITSVINTIVQVADQTNLLSLNASLEASEAKEYGRGFAVIAEEIRRLADETASAAINIEETVNEILSSVSASVTSVSKFSIDIRSGAKEVETVAKQLTTIVDNVQSQTVKIEEVNLGMQAQAEGADQINTSIAELSESAKETSSMIRQFNDTISLIKDATESVQASINLIKK